MGLGLGVGLGGFFCLMGLRLCNNFGVVARISPGMGGVDVLRFFDLTISVDFVVGVWILCERFLDGF